MYAYYGDGWKLAKRTSPEDCRFELSVEDHFIYLITHFAKHYRDAGAGIKSVIDIWLYKKKHTEMDMKYVKAQLKRLKLSNFADNVFRMAGVWFDDEKEDNLTSRMSAFVIKSTAFGTYENQVLAKTIREYQDKDIGKAVKYRYLDALFPKLEHMKQIYPVLNKMSVLLPVFWLIRIFQRTFWGEKTVSEYKRKVDILENDNIADFKKHIKEVGLDIYNGRNKE